MDKTMDYETLNVCFPGPCTILPNQLITFCVILLTNKLTDVWEIITSLAEIIVIF